MKSTPYILGHSPSGMSLEVHAGLEEAAKRDTEARAYMQLPEVQEFVQALDRSYDLFQASLAEEGGEMIMVHLLRDAREAHDLIVESGKDRLKRSGSSPYLHV